MFNSWDPMDCSLPGSYGPWHSPGKNTRVGFLLQAIFLTQGINLHLLHYRRILYGMRAREAQKVNLAQTVTWTQDPQIKSMMIYWAACLWKVAWSCLILCDPIICSQPDSSVQGILQARILEWVTTPFSGDLPNPGIESRSPELQEDLLPCEPSREHWMTKRSQRDGNWYLMIKLSLQTVKPVSIELRFLYHVTPKFRIKEEIPG